MHPDGSADHQRRDPISDGRDSLRLVKIRLALTLLTVAILPVAAVAPMIRAITDDSRVAQHTRLAADADHTASDVERELDGIRVSLAALAADADIVAALSSKASAAVQSEAATRLTTLTARPSAAVATAVLLRPKGEVVARAGDPGITVAASLPPIGIPAYRITDPDPPRGASIEISMAVGAAGKAAAPGVVVASVSLDRLLTWAAPDDRLEGRSVRLEADDGTVLASTGSFDATTLPGTVLDLTTEAGQGTDASAPIAVDGLPAWHVAADAPLALTTIGLPAVAALLGLLGLLVLFTVWMGRQIVRPAAQLEAQRARLHELYESERAAGLLDGLTGLGNHRAFQEAIGRMTEAARRYQMPFALVLLDIDEFKRVNDTRGHGVGDELLAQLGEIIRKSIRASDSGFRIGGDEFALLLPHTDAAGAETLARRILARGLETRAAATYGEPISFSAGITACPSLGTERQELTSQADAALYRGKRAGRTVVTVFDPALDRSHVDEGMRAELSSAISRIIEAGSLSPVYQPIVHLPTGRVLGYEGLVRVAPGSPFPHTGALFDAAEVAGRVLDLDRAALDVVLAGASAIPDPLLLSLNVSPRSFEAPEFNATVLLAILRRHGFTPDRVILELTERDAIRDPEKLRAEIVALQAAGVRVAADDVGAGNAGLRLLSQFRFDVVKIDLSLVQGGASKDQTLSVLTTLAELAARWGALTIAEGVETSAQLRTIRELGIDSAQGYLLGRPGPKVDLERVDLDELAAREDARPAGSPMPALSPAAALFAEAANGNHVRAALGVVPIARPSAPGIPTSTAGRR